MWWVGWGRKRRFMIVNIIGLKRFYPLNPNTRSYLGITIIFQSFSYKKIVLRSKYGSYKIDISNQSLSKTGFGNAAHSPLFKISCSKLFQLSNFCIPAKITELFAFSSSFFIPCMLQNCSRAILKSVLVIICQTNPHVWFDFYHKVLTSFHEVRIY